MANPQQAHLNTSKHILRYLKHTIDQGILYKVGTPIEVLGYANADTGSCPKTRRSMGAYIFIIAGGPISWQITRQLII
jgi:hypothetical protein